MQFRPYQLTGAKWLLEHPLRLLGDSPGLGKTAQCIKAFDTLTEEKAKAAVLIVCPAIARLTWKAEFEKFSVCPPRIDVILSGRDAEDHTPGNSIAASFEMAAKYGAQWLEKTKFDALIIDEVHFLKSVDAKRAKAILGSGGLAHKIGRVWALSGTPADNHAGELWILLYSFGVTALTYEKFVDRFCYSYQTGPYAKLRISGTKPERIPELRQMLSKVMLRRKKEDVLTELPPIQYGDISVEPGEVPVDILLKTKLEEQSEEVRYALTLPNPVAALEALAGSVSTLRRYNGLQKISGTVDLINTEFELELYKKIVIFAVHVDVIDQLAEKLSHLGVAVLYGSTPAHKRQEVIYDFQTDVLSRIFIGNIRACGTNITLTAADQVLMVEREWVPSQNSQAIQRLHRIGQTRNVTCRTISLPDSLDQRVNQVLSKKEESLSQIFDVSSF